VATNLATFRSRIRDRADLVNDMFIQDGTLNQWINDSISELYDLLVQASEDWYVVSTPQTVTAPASTFTAPAGMLRFHGLDRDLGGGTYESVKRGVFRERLTYTERRYVLTAGTFRLFPVSSAPGNYVVWYTPVFTPMEDDGDTFDGIDGWEEYVVVDVAAKCREKAGDEDPSDFLSRKAVLRARIQTMTATRDGGEPPRVVDVHADDEYAAETPLW